tara:strand:+ start:304 stop:537 length:234 start_codon:yes stop_codon:yes gene_type:complete
MTAFGHLLPRFADDVDGLFFSDVVTRQKIIEMMDQEDERRGVFEGLHVGIRTKVSLLEQRPNTLDRFGVIFLGPKNL